MTIEMIVMIMMMVVVLLLLVRVGWGWRCCCYSWYDDGDDDDDHHHHDHHDHHHDHHHLCHHYDRHIYGRVSLRGLEPLIFSIRSGFASSSQPSSWVWHCAMSGVSRPNEGLTGVADIHTWCISVYIKRYGIPAVHALQYLWHDDVIKWKHFPRYCPFVRGIHRSPVGYTHKGQWLEAFIYFFFDLHPNKRFSKQPKCRWFETPSHSL